MYRQMSDQPRILFFWLNIILLRSGELKKLTISIEYTFSNRKFLYNKIFKKFSVMSISKLKNWTESKLYEATQ